MAPLTLVIGNKNYSGWSLRPWLFMKHVGLEFQELMVPLDTPETREQIDRYTPSGRVPVLRQGALCVWDSLAICEYIAELSGTGHRAHRGARGGHRAHRRDVERLPRTLRRRRSMAVR